MSPDPDTARLLAVIARQAGLSAEAGLVARLNRLSPGADRAELATRLERLSWRDPDWQAVIGPLLVHETYLFRDWPQLDHLARTGLPERIMAGRRALHLWSAGCASGEEAYSLAALALTAMQQAGVAQETDGLSPVAGWHLAVLGSDLSRDMIGRAERGIFATSGLSAFRAMPRAYGHFFPAHGSDARAARADLRTHTRFVSGNLLEGPLPVLDADVVACRNVLIYLSQAARQAVLERLAKAVAPGGFLLLGPTDPAPPPELFEPLWSPAAVIYQRRKPQVAQTSAAAPRTRSGPQVE